MSSNQNAQDVIASALALPADQRLVVLDAIHVSLVDRSLDHGPEEPADEVAASWKEEIARRIADLDSGSIITVPAERAERMIREDAKPAI